MAEWVTIYDNGPGEVADVEQSGADTEESRLYSLRVTYHKALSTLNMSKTVGDSQWEQAKAGLISASNSVNASLNKLNMTSISESFISDCKQVSFLVLKNLSRVLRKEGPDSYESSLQYGLEACSVMFELQNFDVGLVFHMALLSMKTGRDWSCRQLLTLNKGNFVKLYERAVLNLEKAVEDESTDITLDAGLGVRAIAPGSTQSTVSQPINVYTEDPEQHLVTLNSIVEIIGNLGGGRLKSDCTGEILELLRKKVLATSEEGGGGERDPGPATNPEACDSRATAMKEDTGNTDQSIAGDYEIVSHPAPTPSATAVDETTLTSVASAAQVDEMTLTTSVVADTNPLPLSLAVPVALPASLESNRRSSRRKTTSAIFMGGQPMIVHNHPDVPPPATSATTNFWRCTKVIYNNLVSTGLREKDAQASVDFIRGAPGLNGLSSAFPMDEVRRGTGSSSLPSVPLYRQSDQSSSSKYKEVPSELLTLLAAGDVLGFCQRVIMGFSAVVNAQDAIMDNLHWHEVPQAIVTCWTLLLEYHNSDVHAAFALFDELEVLFIAECCSDLVKAVESADTGEDVSVEMVANMRGSKLTMNALILMWPSNNEQMTATKASIARIRRVWLFLTYWLTGKTEEQSSNLLEVDTKELFDGVHIALEQLQPFRLPHLRDWNIIDADHAKLLESVLQDNVTVKSLVQKHEVTSEWLQRALELLEKGEDMKSMMKSCAKRGDKHDACLPLLVLRTLSRVEHNYPLLMYYNRVVECGIIAIIELLREGMDDREVLSQWLVDSFDYMESSVLRDDGHPVSKEDALSATRSMAYLVMTTCTMSEVVLFEKISSFFMALAEQLRSHEHAGDVETVVARTLIALKHTCDTDSVNLQMYHVVHGFILKAISTGSITSSNMSDEELLGVVAAVHRYRDERDNSNNRHISPSVEFTESAFVLSSCLALRLKVTPDQRILVLQEFHNIACDDDLYALDKGNCLAYLASLLQEAVSSSYFVFKRGQAPQPKCFVDFEDFSAAGKQDVGTCLGEMYWLLYSFPLISFTYTDSSKQSTRFDLPLHEEQTIEMLYIFYAYCALQGLGSRPDRRASLLMLTQTTVLREGPLSQAHHEVLFQAIFNGSQTFQKQEDIDMLLQLNDQPNTELMMPETLLGIFYERLVYSGDPGVTSEILGLDYISNTLSVPEQRVIHAIELCLKDLTFNPKRLASWALLHLKLVEYLHITCDSLGEQCVPELMPASAQLDFKPRMISLNDLLEGRHRTNLGLIWRMTASYDAVNGGAGTLEAAVKSAWVREDNNKSVEVLLGQLGLKNLLRQSIMNVFAVLEDPENRLSKETALGPAISQEEEADLIVQPLIIHGKAMELLAKDFDVMSPIKRRFLTKALSCYKAALDISHTESTGAGEDKLPLKTRLFLLCKNAELEWLIFSRLESTLVCLVEIRDTLCHEGGKTSLRNEVVNDTTPVIFGLAQHLLANASADQQMIVDLDQVSTSLWARKPPDENSLDHIPVADNISRVWRIILNCFRLMREVRQVSQHDFKSVLSLADFIFKLHNSIKKYTDSASSDSGIENESKFVPEWFYTEIQKLGVCGICANSALLEIHQLFAKKYHQLVAVWSVEKPFHEWDSQLQRTYNFEHLRREITRKYFDLCVLTSNTRYPVDLIKEAVGKKQKTATIHWIIDQGTRTIAKIVSHSKSSLESLQIPFEILQMVHEVVSRKAIVKLQNAMVQVYRDADVGSPASDLTAVLRFCFETYGASGIIGRGESKKRKLTTQASSKID